MDRVILILTVLFVLTGCSNPGQEEYQKESQRPSQESWNSEIYLTKLGVRKAVVQSGHLAQYDNMDLLILNQDVISDFFKENKHSSTMTADSAVIFREKNVMRAYNNVIVRSDSGVTLYTERLMYSPSTEKITSDTTIKLTTELDTLYGIGFESNPDLTEWEIEQPWGVTQRELKK